MGLRLYCSFGVLLTVGVVSIACVVDYAIVWVLGLCCLCVCIVLFAVWLLLMFAD